MAKKKRPKKVPPRRRIGAGPGMAQSLQSMQARALEVYEKTWALVAAELGGSMPEVVFHSADDPDLLSHLADSPGAAMWAERRSYTFEQQLAFWEAAGRPEGWTAPTREIVHITPSSWAGLASDNAAWRRREQKHLFHEFKHTRQSDALRSTPACERDASLFAQRKAAQLLRTDSKRI